MIASPARGISPRANRLAVLFRRTSDALYDRHAAAAYGSPEARRYADRQAACIGAINVIRRTNEEE